MPPGDEGKVLAQSLFEGAWDLYESQIPYLKSWNPDEQAVRVTLEKLKHTFGRGTTDYERKAYLVEWEFVKSCLDAGVTYEELAQIKEKDIPNYVLRN